MIIPPYHIGPSSIAGAGQGLFIDEPLARGRVLVAPDAIPAVHRFDEILARPDVASLLPATPPDCELVILAAAWLGKTRLIDNLTLTLPLQ